MSIKEISLSSKRARVRTMLLFAFSIVLLSNMVGTPFTKSVAYASSMDTLQTSTDSSTPLRTDVNGDGTVDIYDVVITVVAYGSIPGHLKWDSRADVNDDNVVDIFDLIQVRKDHTMKWVRYDFDEPLDWNVVGGDWSTINGLLDGFGNAESLIYTDDTIWSDCTLTAKVKIAADEPSAEVALCFRLRDSGNFYWAGLGCWDHRVSISRMVDHVPEELIFSGNGADVLKDTWYIMSIEVSGDTIMFYVNDVLELVINDSTFMNGMIGLRPWNSHVLVDHITTSGYVSSLKPEKTALLLKGVSWYGIDSSNPSSLYKMTEDYFDFLTENLPDTSLLSLMVSAYTIMPKIREGNYYTIDYAKLDLLRNFVSWCKPHGIGILVVNDWNSLNEAHLKAYWKFMSQQFKDENVIIGFDLINEPWSFAHGNVGLIELYERTIDAIRSVDPDRTCYVQSMYYHYEGSKWRDVLMTNPVNRPNVVYVSHLYSNNYNTGAWYNDNNHPWVQHYLGQDYEKAKEVLKNELYERFGFIKAELGYPVAVTEVAFRATEEGLTYGRDTLEILNEWNISWAYHAWYTNEDRPLALTYPNGTLRPQAITVQNAF